MHMNHSITPLHELDDLKLIMKRLSKEITEKKIIMTQTAHNIKEGKEEFRKCLRQRKFQSIIEYIEYLNKEEEKLVTEFDEVVLQSRKEFSNSYSNLQEMLEKKDSELYLFGESFYTKEDSLKKLYTITMADKENLLANPLGTLTVTKKHTNDKKVLATFSFEWEGENVYLFKKLVASCYNPRAQ